MNARMCSVNDESIADAILARARTTGARVALRTSFGSWTGSELVHATVRTAQILRHRYPDTGSPVLVLMTGDLCSVAAFLAADLVGRIAVLLHPSSTGKQIRSAAVATRAELFLQSIHAPLDSHALGERTEQMQGLTWTVLSQVVAETEASGRLRPSGFLCQQTSGTMGDSKFALRTRAAVSAEMDVLGQTLGLTRDDVVLCSAAVSHSYGCIGGLLAPLLAGATVTLARDPDETRVAVLETEPSIVYGLGPTYAALVDMREQLDEHLRRVRFAFSAGAPLPTGLYERFNERFAVPIRQDYGTSETGTISLDVGTSAQPRSVGQPLSHMNIRLRPPVDIPLGPGEEGEILVRSSALAGSYLVRGEPRPCTDESGWYATQDAGSWEGGSLCVTRRLRPLPVINGERVNLDDVERLIQDMPGVTEAVVWPEAVGDRSVLIAGVAGHVGTADEVRAWSLQRLPRNWVPDRISVFERLPRSPAGKILNRYLRAD